MSDWVEYKGYVASVRYSDEDEIFHGRLEGISDLVTYEESDVATLKSAFHEAVDDYLAICRKENKEPQVPYRGTFNVRVGPGLHRRAAVYATGHQKKLNSVVAEALERFLEVAER
jgi:predicted HicB family RNase H-like nuclease